MRKVLSLSCVQSRGVYPKVETQKEQGELRTVTQLVLDIAEVRLALSTLPHALNELQELLPSVNSLVLDPFASHIVRALLVALCPDVFAPDSAILRSKKSAAWKAKQGGFKSVLEDEKGKGKSTSPSAPPPPFREMARRLVVSLREGMDANEVRSLAANKASSPVLQARSS